MLLIGDGVPCGRNGLGGRNGECWGLPSDEGLKMNGFDISSNRVCERQKDLIV